MSAPSTYDQCANYRKKIGHPLDAQFMKSLLPPKILDICNFYRTINRKTTLVKFQSISTYFTVQKNNLPRHLCCSRTESIQHWYNVSRCQGTTSGGMGGICSPIWRLCPRPPTCPQSEEKNGQNQPFSAKFWVFAPQNCILPPRCPPNKNFWCRHWQQCL